MFSEKLTPFDSDCISYGFITTTPYLDYGILQARKERINSAGINARLRPRTHISPKVINERGLCSESNNRGHAQL